MSAIQVLQVSGLHCHNRVAGITEELEELEQVGSVQVELVPDGVSTVTIGVAEPVSEDTLQNVLQEAGFALVGVK